MLTDKIDVQTKRENRNSETTSRMVIEGKMSTMSSPLYPTSPMEEKEGYEGTAFKLQYNC